MAEYSTVVAEHGYNKLITIKTLTKEALKKMMVKDGHVHAILHGIKDLEEWPINL